MPRKEAKRFQWGSSGGFAMMCFEFNHSPVQGDLDQTSAHHAEQPHSEEKNLEVHLEESLGNNMFQKNNQNKVCPKYITQHFKTG